MLSLSSSRSAISLRPRRQAFVQSLQGAPLQGPQGLQRHIACGIGLGCLGRRAVARRVGGHLAQRGQRFLHSLDLQGFGQIGPQGQHLGQVDRQAVGVQRQHRVASRRTSSCASTALALPACDDAADRPCKRPACSARCGFFEHGDWELISEAYQFNNVDMNGAAGKQRSWAGFLQAGYTVAPRRGVFGRAAKAALSGSDPYFVLQNSGSSYRQWAAGLRFDLDPRAALKLQIDRNVDAANAAGAVKTLHAQPVIGF